jgi:hypothetical protein
MARQNNERDISPILSAANHWISDCLIKDGSIFAPENGLPNFLNQRDCQFSATVEGPSISVPASVLVFGKFMWQ